MVDDDAGARLRRMEAVVFDMDGVVTDTAGLHADSWEETFNEFLRERAAEAGEPFRPFNRDDYLRHVDGKPRYDGVRDFLASRGIYLPEGDPSDPPEARTVCGLGNLKNLRFQEHLEAGRARPYPGTVQLVDELRRDGIAVAVITSSRNGEQVLFGAGVRHLFPVKVDGVDCARLGLAGKPEPDIFLEAARRLGVEPARTAVVEDAESGVEAGRVGGFGLVVGVDRGGHADRLRDSGADFVITDLSALLQGTPIVDLPSALDGGPEADLAGRRPAVFLDYDGTLTPIVSHPDEAVLAAGTRSVLADLASRHPTAVVSGRDRADVEGLVGLAGLVYAGSHGFDISGPGGLVEVKGLEHEPALAAAADELKAALGGLSGVWVERKRLAVAVHFRQAPSGVESGVEEATREVASRHPGLRVSGGKMIFELRPAIEWDKGMAVLRLLDVLGLGDDVAPLYIGDDETDEDAFRVLRSREGIGIVVGADHRRSLARYRLADPGEVSAFLSRLAGWSHR